LCRCRAAEAGRAASASSMALFGSFVASRPWLTTSESRNDVFALINNWGNRESVRWGESAIDTRFCAEISDLSEMSSLNSSEN